MHTDPYKRLAERLDALPNGFPATAEGTELRLLAKLFTPEEAELTAQLGTSPETPAQLAARLGGEPGALGRQLKSMARRGLIAAERGAGGLGYKLLPFVVGIYELQMPTMDAELARLFEDYYRQGFTRLLSMTPPVHRVVPVGETVRTGMEIRPFESAASIVAAGRAWGVTDCICRKQQALVGTPCRHPVDVCMVIGESAGVFDNSTSVRALSQDEALATLRRAAEAGLVHSVSNTQESIWYICNCCTCGCGILRALAEMGIANVVARSAFVNAVDADRCIGCGVCPPACQFNALALVEDRAQVNATRCVGCGVCVLQCPEGALALVRRPEAEIPATPVTEAEWGAQRLAARGLAG